MEIPLLSIIVPAYNAQEWLVRCLDSLTAAGPGAEVIVVDDGSRDGTLDLAHDYASTHPGVRVIHQENKGHGGAVNTGIACAAGTWVKVCDSDDAMDPTALRTLLVRLGQWRAAGREPDLVITNFVYVREGSTAWRELGRRPRLRAPRASRSSHAVRFRSALPVGRLATWDDVGRFRPDQYLMMHSLTYRREVLEASGMRLPEHCFYVDTLYAFAPLPRVRSLFYLDLDLYLYTVGREGQSVADEVIVKRLDQHDRVNALLLDSMPRDGEVCPALMRYMIHLYTMSAVVITTMALRSGTARNLAIRDELWARLDRERPDVSQRVRASLMGRLMTLPGQTGRLVPIAGYQVARRVLALN